MRLAVALPGRAYPVTLPAIAAVVDVVAEVYDVRPVDWGRLESPPDDPAGWVRRHLDETLAGDRPDLVVGKSMSTLAAPYAAGHAWPAIWITPLLLERGCVQGIRANQAPQLLVCGLDDPFHDATVAGGLDCEVLELPGVDHALSSTGDAVVAESILSAVADATRDFLRRLP